MPQNRHTISVTLALSHSVANDLRRDPALRIMLYCAASSPSIINVGAYVDVAFPNQLEVKVNGDEVKSNFKGLKNKPGTTKPADITDLVRRSPDYKNILTVTYALTTKVCRNPALKETHPPTHIQRYSVVVILVKKTPADELAERIKAGRRIPKAQVVQESTSQWALVRITSATAEDQSDFL
jgi:E3 SUMO-protein ligase PIAS1